MSTPNSNEAIDAWFAPDPPSQPSKDKKPTSKASGGMCHLCTCGWGLVFKSRRRVRGLGRQPGGQRASGDATGRGGSSPGDPSGPCKSARNNQAAADDVNSITSTIGSFLHALVSPLSSVTDAEHRAPVPTASRASTDLTAKSDSLAQFNTAIPSKPSAGAGAQPSQSASSTDTAPLSSTPLSASLPSVFRSVLSLTSPTLMSAELGPTKQEEQAAPATSTATTSAAAIEALPTEKSAELIELEKALGIYIDDQDAYALVTASDHEDDEDAVADRRKRTADDALPLHVTLNGRLPTTKDVCTPAMADQLRKHFPALARLADAWSLVYSMDQHGISLSTLYDRVRQTVNNKVVQPRGFVLVVQDSNGKRFGAYLSDGLKISAYAFYGTGETFVFSYDEGAEQIKVYPWTGMNDFFIFGDPQYFAVGASDGKFAIWLDHELERGKSDPTSTFDNPTLSSERDFECYELELWGMST